MVGHRRRRATPPPRPSGSWTRSSTPAGACARWARDDRAYNPLGYHTGTVWPHDNALIAAGLARARAARGREQIAGTLLAAAPYFAYRLPEVFAGYPAALTGAPVRYPTASRPQAWAAGAPLQLLTMVLDLEPHDAQATALLPGSQGPGSAVAATLRRERVPA